MTGDLDDPAEQPGGFTDVSPLGQGAFGAVWQARDTTGRPVAIKVLQRGAARAETAWQFEAEYRALGRLSHPAFPAALARGRTASGKPWYAMDLLAGEAPRGPWPASRVRQLLAAVAEALAHLHALGLVHGDLKPENLRVAGEAVGILDLGLAAAPGQLREGLTGTLEYLAPEAWCQAPVSASMDLYALGVTAYELWTGALPFRGSLPELARAHLTTPPPAPPQAAEDPTLASLIAALLAKHPQQRPASALATLTSLGHEVEPDRLSAPAGLHGGDLVGREAWLARWGEALDAPGGKGLVASGTPGVGKTRLLDEFRLAALLKGRHWARAACLDPGDTPGAPWRAVVEQVLEASHLTPEPSLTAWLRGDSLGPLETLEPQARRLAIAGSVASLLVAAARHGHGLAVLLDDWHRADPLSRDILEALRRGVEGRLAWAVAGDALDDPGAETIAPLTEEETAQLVASRLGGDTPEGLAARLAPAGGQPLLIGLMLEHLVARGALVPSTTGWKLEPSVQATLPANLVEAWRARTDTLSPHERQLAAAAGIGRLAGALPPTWLTEAAGLDPDEAAPALEALLRARLLQLEGANVRLVAPEIALALAAEAPTAWQAQVAGRLARHLRDQAKGSLDAVARAAWVALGAEDADLALPLVAEAGRALFEAGAAREARRLLEAAAPLEPQAPALLRLRLALPLAEACRSTDGAEEATAAFERALALAEPLEAWESAARAWIGLGKCRQSRGDYPSAREAYRLGAEAATRAGDAAQAARAMVAEARALAFEGDAEEALVRAREAVHRAAGVPAMRAHALILQASMMAQLAPQEVDEAGTLLTEALTLCEAVGDRVGKGLALDTLGNARLAVGDLPGASAAFTAYGDHCEQNGMRTEGLFARLNRALVAAEAGDHEVAEAFGEQVAARATALGRRYVAAAAETALARAAWETGRWDRAQALFDSALATASAIRNRLLEEHVRAFRLEAALARGNVNEAREEAEHLTALVAASGHAEMRDRLALGRAEIARLNGDMEAAEAAALPLTSSHNRVIARQAWRVLARVRAERGATAAGLEAAARALAVAEAWQYPAPIDADRRLVMDLLSGTPSKRAAQAPPGVTNDVIADEDAAAWLGELGCASDEAALAKATLAGALALVRAERGYVLTYGRGRLNVAVATALDLAEVEADGYSRSMVEQALFTGEILYVPDAGADATWREARSVMALSLRTVVCLPLVTPDAVLGVVYLDRSSPEPLLGPGDLAKLRAFTAAAAGQLVRERARAAAALGADVISVLGAAVARQAPPLAAAEALLAMAMEAVEAERAFWLVPNSAGGFDTAYARAREGLSTPEGVSQGVAAHVAGTGEPLALLDAGTAEGWEARASVQALGLRSVWCLPAGTPDGALLYLDTRNLALADPHAGLEVLEQVLGHARPLLG